MPRNPNKRRCAVPGCKAWAKHGHELCASHLLSQTARSSDRFVVPLLKAAAEASQTPLTDNLEMIDRELHNLCVARSAFLQWAHRQSAEEAEPPVAPPELLAAWNQVTARIIQMLRIRRQVTDRGSVDPFVTKLMTLAEQLAAHRGELSRAEMSLLGTDEVDGHTLGTVLRMIGNGEPSTPAEHAGASPGTGPGATLSHPGEESPNAKA